jgi:hypothetical protein
MINEKWFRSCLLGVVLISAGTLFAQRPVENIDPKVHPNLSQAQHHIQSAYDETEAAQKHYKDELGGHAQKVKEHLLAADRELKLAAEYADGHHK